MKTIFIYLHGIGLFIAVAMFLHVASHPTHTMIPDLLDEIAYRQAIAFSALGAITGVISMGLRRGKSESLGLAISTIVAVLLFFLVISTIRIVE